MPSVARDGLAWDDGGLDLTPVWTREPTLEAIAKVCREKLRIENVGLCEVSFYAQGAFNKLYLARTSQRQLLMRVSLPVYPRNKTRGEVTTLRFLRRETDVPVPEVVAFDDSADNEIGFE
ncbi:altered inheritance of mitochondria 9, mitochondrial [Trichoderma arundinaceum]|uniref:Altered inheritance of mitochondria 9, mitochondrial n=1 Tax=Trichoderma arundinaceum TaxID=490622 RepID=A0A395NBM6_TRIAR|nr:altered inheritance of mitochondria 9, mitochondrial [Trichoderma arundinaceum]